MIPANVRIQQRPPVPPARPGHAPGRRRAQGRGGRSRARTLALLLVLAHAAPAQAVVESRERLITGLGSMDDIDYVAGSIPPYLVSLPAQNLVGWVDPALNVTPLTSGAVHGMAMEPGGQALWVADFGPGTLRRIDLQTGQTTLTLSGFDHPLEIYFTSAATFIVGSLLTPDFWSSPGYLKRVTLPPGGGPPVIETLTGSLVGGMDVVVNGEGRLLVVSLGSPTLDEVDPTTGAVTPVAGPVLGGTDLVEGPGNIIYACTLLAAEVLEIDPSGPSPTLIQIAALLGEAPGPGCEDMAYDAQGRLLVSMNNGELWRLPLQGELLQEGPAFAGVAVTFQLDLPAWPGGRYQLAASQGLGPPLPVGGTGEGLMLALDPLFHLSIEPGVPVFQAWGGFLDAAGRATAGAILPQLPPGSVWQVFLQAVIWEPAALTFLDVTDVLHVRVFS